MDHNLVYLSEPCYAGPPKTNGSWWRVLTKLGTLEKGMANDSSMANDSFLENPMNSVKRQKDMTPEDEHPRSLGVQYTTGEEWRNSSRKNEEAGPKWKQPSVTIVSAGESKV